MVAGALVLVALARAGDFEVPVADSGNPMFTRGDEFPGAEGSAEVVAEGETSFLKIDYDFSGGGQYVSAGLPVAPPPGRYTSLSFVVKGDSERLLGLRLIDQSGECFQFRCPYDQAGEEQKFEVEINDSKAPHWGGDGNGVLDLPLKDIWFVVNDDKNADSKGSVFFGRIKLAE